MADRKAVLCPDCGSAMLRRQSLAGKYLSCSVGSCRGRRSCDDLFRPDSQSDDRASRSARLAAIVAQARQEHGLPLYARHRGLEANGA